jgi:hypothetical protein
MRYGGVIALVIVTLSAWGQECGQVAVRGPKELVAGGIWSLAAHWTALPPGKNINIRIDAPAPFTVLSIPAEGRADSGVARPVLITSAHAEARTYWIRVAFEGACPWGKVDDSLRVRVLPKPRLIAKIISAGKDSAKVLITNTGNVVFNCGQALITPTESYEYQLYRKDNRITFSAQSANGWDTLVGLGLAPVGRSESVAPVFDPGVPWFHWRLRSVYSGRISQLGTVSLEKNAFSARGLLWNNRLRGSAELQLPLGSLSAGHGILQRHVLSRAEEMSYVRMEIPLNEFTGALEWRGGQPMAGLRWTGASLDSRVTLFGGGLNQFWGMQHRIQLGSNELNFSQYEGMSLAQYNGQKGEHRWSVHIAHIPDKLRAQAPFSSFVRAHASGALGPNRWLCQSALFADANDKWNQFHLLQNDFTLGHWRFSTRGQFFSSVFTSKQLRLQAEYRSGLWQWQSSGEWRQLGNLPPQMLYQHQLRLRTKQAYLQAQFRHQPSTGLWSLLGSGNMQHKRWSLRIQSALFGGGNGGARHQQTLQLIHRTAHGNLSVSVQSMQRATIGWNGSLNASSRYKKLSGHCRDEQGNPIEGVEISAQGKSVITDPNGTFSFAHLEGPDVLLKIHAASLPFATQPILGYEQHQFLERRRQHCNLGFYRTLGVRGIVTVQRTHHAALHQKIDLASLELTLYHEDSSSYTTPVREDGQFTLGGLPEGHYCGALAPAPQGFSYTPITIDIREGSPIALEINLVELPQHIPFQVL